VPEPLTERAPGFLSVEGISAGYGGGLVVRDVSLSVGTGEIVSIIGPNGSGKSTLLKAIAGVISTASGTVRLQSDDVTNLPGEILARRGIGYVPQEKEVFASLTVRENLEMGGYRLSRAQLNDALGRVLDIFDQLRGLERSLAGRLSGGERKMLAMGRVLMADPKVVLLDEPTANLSPIASQRILAEQVPLLAKAGVAVLLVEQRAIHAVAVSDWTYVLVGGAVELECASPDLANKDLGALFLAASKETPA